MSLPVRFSAEASSEFDDAAAWYDEQRPGLGHAFIDAVEATIARLADWPRSGAPEGLAADVESQGGASLSLPLPARVSDRR